MRSGCRNQLDVDECVHAWQAAWAAAAAEALAVLVLEAPSASSAEASGAWDKLLALTQIDAQAQAGPPSLDAPRCQLRAVSPAEPRSCHSIPESPADDSGRACREFCSLGRCRWC